jgi:uncharacterized SAM-dependent methyltransferase
MRSSSLDLVKDPAQIEAAERFVRNVFAVVNRTLGGNFDQSRFAFESRWDAYREWMDIGFRSREAQTVDHAGRFALVLATV